MSHLPVRIAPQDVITRIRGHAIILDADLATLYGVTVKRLNQQMTRNRDRFPDDFCFRLTEQEWRSLRLQTATLKRGQHRKYMPYVFTEHGAIMVATVLNSTQAVQMSLAVVRAFVKLRRMALSVEALARKVDGLEQKYDKQFKVVFDAVRRLMTPPPESPRKRIGFTHE
jgi:phage regulator Rha-like protein